MDSASRAEKSALKRWFGALVSPPVYDFWCRQLGSTHAWERCHARVIARRAESDNTFSLRLAPNGNFSGFAPGQHVNVTADIHGRRVTRSYSLSNVPGDAGWVEITVRHDPTGQMSSWLFEHAHKGTVLELENVFGSMTSAAFSEHPLLLLAGGSGITPLMSLIREQAAAGMTRPLTLAYWERNETDVCFAEELHSLAERFVNFNVHTVATRQDPSRRISAAQLISLGIETAGTQIFACGSGAFVEQAKQSTASCARFTSEAFTPRPVSIPTDSEHTFSVELVASRQTIEVSNRETLLSALEKKGVVVQTGCRMGVCNTCSCKKVSGVTQNTDTAHVDAQTHSPVRLCVTRATSDLQLAI